MPILCAFDFSPGARRASAVAAALAARLSTPLHLVHALPRFPAELLGDARELLLSGVRRGLEAEGKHLERLCKDVQTHLHVDTPERAVLERSAALKPQWLVVGATGEGEPRGERVGRTADRLAQHAKVPVLVVRDDAPFLRWLEGARPLKVMAALDFDRASQHAWAQAIALAKLGQVSLTGAHVYWPPQQLHRLGLLGLRSYVSEEVEMERTLNAELRAQFPEEPGAQATFVVSAGFGRAADHLAQLAQSQQADLVVVASHSRSALRRLWEGSVSRGVLREAPCAVACVPLGAEQGAPRLHPLTVLAATDFSPAGNQAVAWALATAAPNGKVVLAHVSASRRASGLRAHDVVRPVETDGDDERRLREKLRALALGATGRRDLTLEPLLLESNAPAEALAQGAERCGADLLVIGNRNRNTAAEALFGSTAKALLALSSRPVMVVRAPVE